jgi:hypothetical protein
LPLAEYAPGWLRARGVAPGNYRLAWFEAPGYRVVDPGVMAVRPAPPVQDFNLLVSPGMIISGTVRMKGPDPGRGLLVVRAVRDEILSYEIVECCTESDGSFRMALPWVGHRVAACVIDPRGQILMSSPLVRILPEDPRGHVVDFDLQPASELRLLCDKDLRTREEVFILRVRDESGHLWFERCGIEAQEFSEGTWEDGFRAGVPSGKYTVEILSRGVGGLVLKRVLEATAPGDVEVTLKERL